MHLFDSFKQLPEVVKIGLVVTGTAGSIFGAGAISSEYIGLPAKVEANSKRLGDVQDSFERQETRLDEVVCILLQAEGQSPYECLLMSDRPVVLPPPPSHPQR